MQTSDPEPSPATPETYRYDAFISYRHVEPDRGWAKWLHGALETYRVPKQLVAKGYPKRLGRVFRDEEELPANADLSSQITAALDESKFLIVVCSPRAVESRWVNAEVEHFRKLGRHDRILALLIEGEPGQSFPKALVEIRRSVVDAGSDGTTFTREVVEDVEPLAADVRPERSDQKPQALRNNARLRLMACILGCRFDDLRQRDAERHGQLIRRVGAGLAVMVLVLSGLTVFAFVQRNEAIVQKQNAQTQERIAKQKQAEAEAARAEEKERAEQLKKVSEFQSEMLTQIDTKTAGEGLMADVRERFAAAIQKAGVPEAELAAQSKTLGDFLVRVNATDTAAAMIDRTILEPATKTIDEQFKDDPKTDASLRQSLATLYCERLALYDKAIPLQESALASRRRVLGEEHPITLTSIHNMCGLLAAQGKLAEAEPFFREALEKRRRVLGEEHPDTLKSINNMGVLLQDQGKLTEAEPFFRDALEKRRRVLGGEHPDTLIAISNMGFLLQAQGKLTAAEPFCLEALEKRRRVLGDEHPHTLFSINNTGRLFNAQGKHSEAIAMFAPLEPVARKVFTGGNARRLADFLAVLGRGRMGVGFDAESFTLAESNLLEAHTIYLVAKDRGPAHADTLACIQGLVDLYSAWDVANPGNGYDTKAAEWRANLDAATAEKTKPTVKGDD